jgi:hypothetical protein
LGSRRFQWPGFDATTIERVTSSRSRTREKEPPAERPSRHVCFAAAISRRRIKPASAVEVVAVVFQLKTLGLIRASSILGRSPTLSDVAIQSRSSKSRHIADIVGRPGLTHSKRPVASHHIFQAAFESQPIDVDVPWQISLRRHHSGLSMPGEYNRPDFLLSCMLTYSKELLQVYETRPPNTEDCSLDL